MKKIILVHGLPGSGKTTLSDMLAFKLGAARVNADYVRQHINVGLGFSAEERVEHATRMAKIANITLSGSSDFVVVDFVCPTYATREAFMFAAQHPVVCVWMNTISEGRFEDTNKLYQVPLNNWTSITVDSYLNAEGFAKKAEEIAMHLKQSTEQPRTFFIRYNTQVGDTNLRWRVIDAETMQERLVSDFRVDGPSMFAASSLEYGVTKWNVAVTAVPEWGPSQTVVFK